MSAPPPQYRIGVVSDTHGQLSNHVFEVFQGVNLILHAGDIGREDVLLALEAIAPVCAVAGNVDGYSDGRPRPLARELTTPAGRIALTHGHLAGAPAGNRRQLMAYFARFKPEIIIFGHSHIPCLEEQAGVVLFNPGSASMNRRGRQNTVGLITVRAAGGRPVFEHVEL